MTDRQYNEFQKIKAYAEIEKMEKILNWWRSERIEPGCEFIVTGLKKLEFPSRCAEVTLMVSFNNRLKEVKDYIYLAKDNLNKIADFFRSLGLKKNGQPYRMNWNDVEGRTGKCILISTEDGYKVSQYLDKEFE